MVIVFGFAIARCMGGYLLIYFMGMVSLIVRGLVDFLPLLLYFIMYIKK